MQDRRWAIIEEDGSHVWLGRGTDPSAQELAASAFALDAHGAAAWLAVMSGDYWFEHEVRLLAVKLLTRRACPAEAAMQAFRHRRSRTLVGISGVTAVRNDR